MFPLSGTHSLPEVDHPGSFGFKRKNHIHEGVDIYGQPGDSVFAIEDGIITNIYPFTGEQVGMPWWNNTDAIAITDTHGSWVYGEIEVSPHLIIHQQVKEGDVIGVLKTVLKKDKGLPMTMLHLERWNLGCIPYTMLWKLYEPQPQFLTNPVDRLFTLHHS